MRMITHLFDWADEVFPPKRAYAHCDLPCGVYDPAQARVEAESVKAIMEKYAGSDDETFQQRCVQIKEERAELVKHHLWVLWTDYFKPQHLEQFRGRGCQEVFLTRSTGNQVQAASSERRSPA